MNMEMEMEWNSHIIKSGSVFGTYEFMLSKGYGWSEMNYVVWGVEDNTYMPLLKAVAATLDTHPDILLKDDEMATAIEQQRVLNEQAQANAMTERMNAARTAGGTPKPTGREYWDAGQKGRGFVQGLKNLFTGGGSSRGDPRDVDSQAPDSQGERKLRLRDKFGPVKTIRAKSAHARDENRRKRAMETQAEQEAVKQRLLYGGLSPDDLSDEERGEYEEAVRLIGGGPADAARGRKKTRGTEAELADSRLTISVQDRKKDKENQKWVMANPNKPSSDAPYPLRYARMLRQEANNEPPMNHQESEEAEEEDPGLTDTEMNQLTDDIPEGAETDAPITETPDDSVVAPRETDALVDAAYSRGTSRNTARGLVDNYVDGLGDEGATVQGLKDVLTNDEGKFLGNRKNLYDSLLDHFNLTPEQAEEAVNTIAEEEPLVFDDMPPPKSAKTKVPKAKAPKAKAAEPLDHEEYNRFYDAVRAGDKHGKYEKALDWFKKNKKGVEKEGWDMPPMPKQAKEEGKEEELVFDDMPPPAKKKRGGFDPDALISSDDAINSAWDHLTLLKGR